MKKRLMSIAAAAALSLAACGGGGGGDDAAELSTVPDEALSSSEVFSEWVGARRPSDGADPLAMNNTPPPATETAEPHDID
jgi:ABC-type glycerol-3-phosphate transport system substrate-binding protein